METLEIKEIKGYIPGLKVVYNEETIDRIIGYKKGLIYRPDIKFPHVYYISGIILRTDNGKDIPCDEAKPLLYPITVLIDPLYAEQDYTLIHEIVSIIYKGNVEINNYELAAAYNHVSIGFTHQSGSKFKLHFFIDGSFLLEYEVHRECYLGDVQPIYDFLYAHYIDTRNLIGQDKAINVLSYGDNPYIV